MASRETVVDVYIKNCKFFEKMPKEEVCEVWYEVLKREDYPDELVNDAFLEYLEKSTRPMMIVDIANYRSLNWFRYFKLLEIHNQTGREF